MMGKVSVMIFINTSYLKGEFFKFLLLALVLCTQFSLLNAQSSQKTVRVVTHENLKLVGKILEDNIDELIIVLDIVEDTVTLHKSNIERYYNVNDQYKIFVDNGGYHRKIGWVNSLGFHLGNFAQFKYAGDQLSLEIDYNIYKLIKPRIGLGGGVSFKSITREGELGRENFPRYNFYGLNAYAKYFLTNNRSRLYVDTKIGYSIAGSDIIYYCEGCEPGRYKSLNYSSGYMIQPGIGFEFARNRRLRSGIMLSAFFIDRRKDVEVYAPEKYFNGVMIGFNLYY